MQTFNKKIANRKSLHYWANKFCNLKIYKFWDFNWWKMQGCKYSSGSLKILAPCKQDHHKSPDHFHKGLPPSMKQIFHILPILGINKTCSVSRTLQIGQWIKNQWTCSTMKNCFRIAVMVMIRKNKLSYFVADMICLGSIYYFSLSTKKPSFKAFMEIYNFPPLAEKNFQHIKLILSRANCRQ